MSMPKTLYVKDYGSDFTTHVGSRKLGDVVINVENPTTVGVYRLVEEREYIACETVRRVDGGKKKGGAA